MRKGYELIGVVHNHDAAEMAARLDAAAALALTPRLGAVLKPTRRALWRTQAELDLRRAERRALLETLHEAAPLAPAAPGAAFADLAEAELFLTANAAALEDALQRYGDAEQHRIEIAAPLSEDGAPAADAVTEALAREAAKRVEAAACDIVRLREEDEETALNLAALTNRGEGAAIERALERLDREWGGDLDISLIGPGPATAFASITLDRPEPSTLHKALALFDISPLAPPEELQRAYRAAMKRAHPDIAGPEAAAEAQALAAANATLKPVLEARAALKEAGFPASALAGAPLLARLGRGADALAAE